MGGGIFSGAIAGRQKPLQAVAASLITAALLLACLAQADYARSAPAKSADDPSYALVRGCFALRSEATGNLVAKAGSGYAAGAAAIEAAERLRMQATDLGSYLFFAGPGDFLAADSQGNVRSAAAPSALADWNVAGAGSGLFRITLPGAGNRALATGAGGALVLVDSASAGNAGLFRFVEAQGCAVYPEIETSTSGTPSRGKYPFGEVRGMLDAHMHLMAFEFLGGSVHCGRPWHRYGVEYAMVDCPDHQGGAAPLETGLGGGESHDPVGYPTFKDWPDNESLTHEGSYYKWLERAWRGGLRLYVNLFVDNAVLCEVYPVKRNSCNEMDGVRLQARQIHVLEDYIDAQSGGPGKGFFRIVTNPFQARRVINQGKLAIVLGIEVSKLFDCGIYNEVPECDRAQIDRQLQEVYDLGVRDMELVNKFDNALGGVAGDGGQTGVVTNSGNRYETGQFIQFETCTGPNSDREQSTTGRDQLLANGTGAFIPQGLTPFYPDPPHCNVRGLSDLGEYLIRRMVEKQMIIDPDHLSVLARQGVLSLAEAARYSGVVSSHSWSTDDAYPRIYRLGGVVTPYAGNSTSFVDEWRKLRPQRNPRFYFGFGYGADMNGFGSQGGPREGASANPVTYPFKSFDGVTINRQVSGQRTYDINVDGVDHYGLYPDWIEDLRKIAGDQIVKDMARGAEAYLQMWERAGGVPVRRCLTAGGRFSPKGIRRVRLGMGTKKLLYRAGQPVSRPARAWRYCVRGKRNRKAKVVTVLTPKGVSVLVASTARGYSARGVGPRDRVGDLRKAKRLGGGLLVSKAGKKSVYVHGVRKGKIRFVAVAKRFVAKSPKRLRAHLKLAGLR